MSDEIRDQSFHDKFDEHCLKDWEEYSKRVHASNDYSIDKFDAMVLAISTVGIGFVANYISGLESKDCMGEVDDTLGKFSIILFVVTIIVNLLS